MVACRFAQMKLFQKYSAVILVFAIFLITGCQTPEASKPITANDITPAPLYVTQGDVLEITFPGAKELSGQHKVGADGTITLPLVGQVVASGKTIEQLHQELLKLYEKELKDKEV